MSVIPLLRADGANRTTNADVDIVVPVYNEEQQLATSITALRSYLDASFPFEATVTIADNASTDGTRRIADELAATLDGVDAVHLDRKGRGLALRTAWSRSTATVVAYMDVDLATGLDALLPLVAPLLSGHSDVAIGTRLGPGAHVVRGVRRELISRAYNLLLRIALGSRCTDAQCGFKAMRRPVAAELLPLVEDDEWFFDTEMLVTAQRNGLRIHEVPVDWVDDLDSRVEVTRTAWKDLRGVLRMLGPTARRRSGRASTRAATVERTGPARGWGRRSPSPVAPPSEGWTRSKARSGWRAGAEVEGGDSTAPVFSDELLRFAGVGAVSTVAYAVLFASLQPSMGSYLANAVAIVLCGVGNTAAHRGMAGMAGPRGDRRHRRTAAAVLLGVSLTFTTGALAVMRAAGLSSLGPELCAVTVANIGAAFIRFGILRTWVFRPEFGAHMANHPAVPPSPGAPDGSHDAVPARS